MTDPVSTPHAVEHRPFNRRQSVILVFFCTVVGAAAQIFMKIGGSNIHDLGSLPAITSFQDPATLLLILRWVIGLITNIPLMAGYACYALNTLMLIVALRDGELSKLYPIIALTFVWVNILSVFIFGEKLNAWKLGGIVLIMAGVAVLGQATPPLDPIEGASGTGV